MNVGRLLGLAPGELASLLPSLVVAFACVGANTLSTIAGDTLFLSAFPIEAQSRFYVASAIVRVATSLTFASMAARFVGRRGFEPAVVAATAGSLIASGVLAASHSATVVYLVCIAQLVLPPLLPLIAFNATAGSLDARAARRLLPLLAAASTVGSLLSAAGAGILSARAGLEALFFGASILSFVGVGALVGMARAARATAQGNPRRASRTGVAKPGLVAALRHAALDIREVPAVRIVVVVGLGGALLTNFVDFAFRSALKETYDREAMAQYLGAFTAASNAAILVFQLVLTSRIVGRLGVRAALISGPGALVLLSPALFALPHVAVTTALRFVEFVFRYAVGNSVADLLVVPVTAAVRTRAKLIVKGVAAPLGALLSGLVLSALGAPDRRIVMVLVGVVAGVMILCLRDARQAYAAAIASALGGGRTPSDVSPEAVRLYRSEVLRTLASAVAVGDEGRVARALDLMSERFFSPGDVRATLVSKDAKLRRLGIERAIRLTPPREGDALLAVVFADPDDELEALVLEAARARHGVPSQERLDRALARGEAASTSEAAAKLWATSLVLRARPGAGTSQVVIDASVKLLRKAVIGEDSPKRAAALRALGDLAERRATREIQLAMGSTDPRVFAEAARAAVLVDAPGSVAGLVANLSVASRAVSSARALALAGPRAVRELVDALPTTRGEGAVAPTALASSSTISGTVRAARVLARIGQEAADHVLPMIGVLGYRARIAVARAFGAAAMPAAAKHGSLVTGAMEVLVGYAESLVPHYLARGDRGLVGREIGRRISGSVEASLDLASVGADRTLIARARAALGRKGRDRQNALALVEAVLPASLGGRILALADVVDGRAERAADPDGGLGRLDGWLEMCRLHDERKLPSVDPMKSVLDRVLVLRNVELFQTLSAEELYPVAEIAHTESFGPGEEVVVQGDAAEDLFVVIDGDCEVVKDGDVVATISGGKAFGELSVLDGEPRSATVRAKTAAELLRIPRSEFEALLDESPELAKGVIKALLRYVRRK